MTDQQKNAAIITARIVTVILSLGFLGYLLWKVSFLIDTLWGVFMFALTVCLALVCFGIVSKETVNGLVALSSLGSDWMKKDVNEKLREAA